MKNRSDIKNLTLSAMFLALAFVMPFFTGQIPQIGSMLCPMHIPVLLCGFFCGASWGLGVGFIAPIMRSFVLGMPVMFPVAVCMAVELAAYGFVAGYLHKKLSTKKVNVYISLLGAMIIGRLLWGVAMVMCMGVQGSAFGWNAFLAGAVLNALPGIVIQIVVIPIIVIAVEKMRVSD